MCGIAGFVSLTGNRPDPDRLARMVATLRHRGPDDRGVFTDGPAALGAARLSIIDVAGGHQPISIDGGAITVVQNGEIYNYVELRDELLRAGRRLSTACDTEVIAHLYAMDGVRAFEKHGSVHATLADRDKIGAEDNVQILLGPFHDQRQALLFGVNPFGVQMDGTIFEIGSSRMSSAPSFFSSGISRLTVALTATVSTA